MGDNRKIFQLAEKKRKAYKSSKQNVFELLGNEFDKDGNIVVDLVVELNNGKTENFGKVTYGAYKAIESGKLDSYKPKNNEEKKILDKYKQYTGMFTPNNITTNGTALANNETNQTAEGSTGEMTPAQTAYVKYAVNKSSNIEGVNKEQKLLGGNTAQFIAAPKKSAWDKFTDGVSNWLKETFSGTTADKWYQEATGFVDNKSAWTDDQLAALAVDSLHRADKADWRDFAIVDEAHARLSRSSKYKDSDLVLALSEAKKSWAASPLVASGKNIKAAVVGMASDMASFVDSIGGSKIPGLNKLNDNVIEYGKKTRSDAAEYNRGTYGETLGAVTQGIVNLVPYMFLGSGKAATKALSSAPKYVQTAKAIAKSPSFWYSLTSMWGNKYQEAIDSGASETTALNNAILYSIPSALVEVGGGIGSIDGTPEKLSSTIFQEIGEELGQDILSGASDKATRNPNLPILSFSGDEDAVINPINLTKTALTTIPIVAIGGGANRVVNLTNQRIQMRQVINERKTIDAITNFTNNVYSKVLSDDADISQLSPSNTELKKIGKFYSEESTVKLIIKDGLESPEGTNSRILAEELNNKVKSKAKIKNQEIGQLVVANIKQVVLEQVNEKKTKSAIAEKTIEKNTVEQKQPEVPFNVFAKPIVSVNDVFRDNKTGRTMTVIDRNETTTTVEIDTGTETVTKEFTNEQADNIVDSGQVEKIESASVVDDYEVDTTSNQTVNAKDTYVDETTNNVYKTITGEKLTSKQIDSILSNPTSRTAFERLTGVKLEGTKAEQRALVRNWQNNSSNVENLKLKNANLNSAHAKVNSLLQNPNSANIRTILRSEALTKAFEELTGITLDGDMDTKRAIIKENAELAKKAFADIMENSDGNARQSVLQSADESVETSKEPTVVDTSDIEVSGIVDAMNETFVSGGKEMLLSALANGGHRADTVTLAKAIRKSYINKGTLGKMADFFTDKGVKVISAIESTLDATTTTETVSKKETVENSELSNKSNVDSNADNTTIEAETSPVTEKTTTTKTKSAETETVKEVSEETTEKTSTLELSNVATVDNAVDNEVTAKADTQPKEEVTNNKPESVENSVAKKYVSGNTGTKDGAIINEIGNDSVARAIERDKTDVSKAVNTTAGQTIEMDKPVEIIYVPNTNGKSTYAAYFAQTKDNRGGQISSINSVDNGAGFDGIYDMDFVNETGFMENVNGKENVSTTQIDKKSFDGNPEVVKQLVNQIFENAAGNGFRGQITFTMDDIDVNNFNDVSCALFSEVSKYIPASIKSKLGFKSQSFDKLPRYIHIGGVNSSVNTGNAINIDHVEKASGKYIDAINELFNLDESQRESILNNINQIPKTAEELSTIINRVSTKSETNTKSNDGKKYSLSSMGASFFGNEEITADEFESMLEDGSYKEHQGYKDYVKKCVNVYTQSRGITKLSESNRAEIEKQIEGIINVAIAAKRAGYDIYDDGKERNIEDSKKRLLFSSLEPNSDYVTSSDISTICDKRKNFAEIYEDIVRLEESRGVPKDKRFFNNVDNYFVLHKLMADKGLTIPCEECYVESMRKNLAPMAKAFLDLVTETNPNNKSNASLYNEKGEVKKNNAKIRNKVIELCSRPESLIKLDDITIEMLTTADGLAQLRLQAPLLYETFNSFYGQSKPKMPRAATPFRPGELIALMTDNNGRISKSLVEKIKSTGGFRLQSYSDFQIENYVDVLQTIFEASMLGLNGHAYTKVPAFLEATNGTNLKRNVSIFMYEDDGKWVLDKKNSFPMELEDIYALVASDESGNTSIIAVSQNADMSAWIMANDNVGYGIPFHKSGLKMDVVRGRIVKTADGREVLGYANQKDHTAQQSEVWKKTLGEKKKENTKVKNAIDIYKFWDFENKDNLSQKELIEKNLKKYIDECNKRNYRPKFREYLMNNENVLNNVLRYAKELGYVPQNATVDDISFKYDEYTIPYGYYKFIGDFGMFKPDGTTSPIETLSLENYDFDKAVEFFADSKKLRTNELLQQFENGTVRDKYRKMIESGELTTEQLESILKEKRTEIAQNIVDGKQRYSLSEEENDEYMDAYYDGDEEKAQELVERAAKKAGYNYKAFHHTENAFTVFDLNKARTSMDIQGIYFSADENAESEYGSVRYDTFLKMNNPYIVDSKEKQNAIPFDMSKNDSGITAREWLQKNGYDSVIRKAEYFGAEADEYIVFDSSQIKSAEPFVYADDEYGEGEIISLSERFNPDNNDIRYSLNGSYTPTFYSHMGKTIDEMKQDKVGANSVINYLKGKGVKDEEIKWSGIETFLEGKKSVTKAELQEFVAGSQLQIEETVLDGRESTTLERQEEGSNDYYVMRGGEIYDSLTWDSSAHTWVSDAYGFYFDSMPRIKAYYGVNEGSTRWEKYKLDGGENYREITFKMPNSTYTNDAMKGHWGNDAKGIIAHTRVQDFEVDGKKMLFIEEIQSDWHNEGHKRGYSSNQKYDDRVTKLNRLRNKLESGDYDGQERADLYDEYVELRDELSLDGIDTSEGVVPDAPFRNNYHEYVLKSLIRMAAEQGYDSIGWTPADVQSERWSDDYAEGYRIEYDQDIPKFLNKYGKKWGATVGKTEIGREDGGWYEVDGTTVWSMPITDSMKDSVLYEGQPLYSLEKEGNNNERQNREDLLSRNSRGEHNESTRKQAERIQEFKQKNKGKTRAERKKFAKELLAKGQTEEVIAGRDKYTLIKPEAYNDDMLTMVEDAKSKGYELGFFIGSAKMKFDTKDEFLVNGIIDGSKVLVRYDHFFSPQVLFLHERGHGKWNTPEMQAVKEKVLNDLTEDEKQKILSMDRYADYMEIYEGNEDRVWEEFICDMLSGMNTYTANYIDLVADYWAENTVAEGYNASTYAESIDAGGKQTNAQDAEYLELAKNPKQNEARLREMVDEAAKEAGYTVKGLHSTNADFTVFDIDKTSDLNFHGKGIYFTNSIRDLENNYENYEGPDPWQKIEDRANEIAEEKYGLSYDDTLTGDAEIIDKVNECYDEAIEEFQKTQRRITAYLKFDNPLILEKGGKGSNHYNLQEYDGIIDNQVYEKIGHAGTDENTVHYVVFNPRNIKSADLVTYDDYDNIIPLSERFVPENNDIRYSLDGDDIPDFLDLWEEYVAEYGVIPKGEKPARDIDVPQRISDKDVVSHFARTMLEAGVTPDWAVSEFEKAIVNGEMTHEVVHNKNAHNKAIDNIKKLGFEEALRDWSNKVKTNRSIDEVDFAMGMELYNQCVTNKDVHNAMKLAAELTAEATRSARNLQLCRLLKTMTPDGQLYYLEKSIQKMNEEFKDRLGDKFKDIELDEGLMEKFFNETDEEKRNKVYDDICQDIADQIPATLRDKWDAWRYLAMLGNPRTHIKNLAGNLSFAGAVRLKNYIAATIEYGMEKSGKMATSERTKSFKKSDKAVEFAKEDSDKREVETLLQGVNAKYTTTGDIESKRTIFKNKLLEKYRTITFEGLEYVDMKFLKFHYTDALARLITVRNIDIDSLDRKTLDNLRGIAVREAQKATFRDANAMAEAISTCIKKARNSKKNSLKFAGYVLEGIMPFVKTPMNIAKQGVYYSPAGLVAGTYNAIQKHKGADIATADVIDDFAKGITGTSAMILGYILSSLGILVGGDDEDKKKKTFDELVGEQSYALKLGGHSYTIDWMVPSSMSLFVGNELYKLTKDEFKAADVINAMSRLTEPLLELSVFSGYNNAIKAATYSDTSPVESVIYNALASYVTQALPTIGGQISRIFDKQKREYYYMDKTSDVPIFLQRLIGQASSKIPFASYLFAPSVDEWGRDEEYGGMVERILENAVSPGYYSKENYTEVDTELKRLYDATGNNEVLPTTQNKYFKQDGIARYLSADEYAEVKRLRGQKSFELISELMSDTKRMKVQDKETGKYRNLTYSQMTDAEKVAKIKSCYDDAGEYAKAKFMVKTYEEAVKQGDTSKKKLLNEANKIIKKYEGN